MANTFALLTKIVKETKAFPSWSFDIQAGEDSSIVLVITIEGQDNYHPERPFTVSHFHPVPFTTFNEASWRRWVFERCKATLAHECSEVLNFNGIRPFVPMHGPGEDPYTSHEIRGELDALTTQRGTQREGPV